MGPSESRGSVLRLEFDELFSTHTGYAGLDDRTGETAAKKAVLTEPCVPLYKNASELRAFERASPRRRSSGLFADANCEREESTSRSDVATYLQREPELPIIGR